MVGRWRLLFSFPAMLVMVFGGSFEPTFRQSELQCFVVCMPLSEEA